jgi:hypothetical protein
MVEMSNRLEMSNLQLQNRTKGYLAHCEDAGLAVSLSGLARSLGVKPQVLINPRQAQGKFIKKIAALIAVVKAMDKARKLSQVKKTEIQIERTLRADFINEFLN